MERLPKKYERLLKEIAPHSSDVGYLDRRLSEKSFDDAYFESCVIDDLDELGFIKPTNRTTRRFDKTIDGGDGNPLVQEFSYPREFVMRARGMVYFAEKRRALAREIGWLMLTAVLAGLFSWLFVAHGDALLTAIQ